MINLKELTLHIQQGLLIDVDTALKLAVYSKKEELYEAANEVRKYFTGNETDSCSIINARSGLCSEDCAWCSQSVYHKTGVARYDIIDPQEALDAAILNHKAGVKRFSLVAAGRDFPKKSVEKAAEIYRAITKQTGGELSLCASMGLLDEERMRILKEAGVEHYHINLETSREYFPKLVTKHSFDDKLRTIEAAKKAGLKICSGGIIGMGETMEDRISMALSLQKLGVKSIPLNILNPIKGTKLEGQKPLTDDDILSTTALFRLINPDSFIRLAGGRILITHLVGKAFNCGINALMVGDMLTTVGTKTAEDMAFIKQLNER